MAMTTQQESFKWTPHVEVIKYDPDTVARIAEQLGHEPSGEELRALAIEPDDIATADGNVLTTNGVTRIAELIIGSGSAAFTATQGFCGVGDSTTAGAPGDTALLGTNKFYKIVTTTPSRTLGVISASTDFLGSEANFAWNEWCWGIATGTLTAGTTLPGTSPIILNRKAQGLGTKANGAVWTLSASVTIT